MRKHLPKGSLQTWLRRGWVPCVLCTRRASLKWRSQLDKNRSNWNTWRQRCEAKSRRLSLVEEVASIINTPSNPASVHQAPSKARLRSRRATLLDSLSTCRNYPTCTVEPSNRTQMQRRKRAVLRPVNSKMALSKCSNSTRFITSRCKTRISRLPTLGQPQSRSPKRPVLGQFCVRIVILDGADLT